MADNNKSYEQLANELHDEQEHNRTLQEELLRATEKLEEANDTIEAIRSGEVDALVINGEEGHQIYTLKSADLTYRIFIEQMIQGAVTINRNGIILYSNSQFAALVGKPLEKVIGQSFYQFILSEDLSLCKELVEHAWESILTKGELCITATNSNKDIPVLLSLKTLDLDEGPSLSIIITDLSGQKANERLLEEKNEQLYQAERLATQMNVNLEAIVTSRTNDLVKSIAEKSSMADQLYRSQQQLSKILETMAEGVQIFDTNNQLIYANKMAQEILGINSLDIIKGKYEDPKWSSFKLDGTPLKAEEHPVYLALTTGRAIYDYEICIHPPHREQFYISINAVAIYDEDEKATGAIGTFMDVTHRRKAIQQKDDFISVASHELKTPITSLKAAIQLLERIKNRPGDQLPKLVDQANRSMNKVSNLVEELLNASKITSGQMHINIDEFELAQIVRDSYQHIQSMEGDKIQLSGELHLKVKGDPGRIEQVIINFINNALKYAPASPTIEIIIQDEGDFAKLFVKDKGPGIDPAKLPHLFDRYYRVDDSGQQYSGLGLGLYICAEIVKKHGGTIGADSQLGEGSSFWFTLPLA